MRKFRLPVLLAFSASLLVGIFIFLYGRYSQYFFTPKFTSINQALEHSCHISGVIGIYESRIRFSEPPVNRPVICDNGEKILGYYCDKSEPKTARRDTSPIPSFNMPNPDSIANCGEDGILYGGFSGRPKGPLLEDVCEENKYAIKYNDAGDALICGGKGDSPVWYAAIMCTTDQECYPNRPHPYKGYCKSGICYSVEDDKPLTQ